MYRRTEKDSFRSENLEKDVKDLNTYKDFGAIPGFIKFNVFCPTPEIIVPGGLTF